MFFLHVVDLFLFFFRAGDVRRKVSAPPLSRYDVIMI